MMVACAAWAAIAVAAAEGFLAFPPDLDLDEGMIDCGCINDVGDCVILIFLKFTFNFLVMIYTSEYLDV